MKNSERFERLCERLLGHAASLEAQTLIGPGEMTFTNLCQLEGLSEVDAENLFYAHFGLSPECLMRCAGLPKNTGIC